MVCAYVDAKEQMFEKNQVGEGTLRQVRCEEGGQEKGREGMQ